MGESEREREKSMLKGAESHPCFTGQEVLAVPAGRADASSRLTVRDVAGAEGLVSDTIS